MKKIKSFQSISSSQYNHDYINAVVLLNENQGNLGL